MEIGVGGGVGSSALGVSGALSCLSGLCSDSLIVPAAQASHLLEEVESSWRPPPLQALPSPGQARGNPEIQEEWNCAALLDQGRQKELVVGSHRSGALGVGDFLRPRERAAAGCAGVAGWARVSAPGTAGIGVNQL